MNYNNPLQSVVGQAQTTTQRPRRSSLNFFRRISSSENRTTNINTYNNTNSTDDQSLSQPRLDASMMFKSSAKDASIKAQIKQEVAPSKQSPRIPSLNFDLTNIALSPRYENASSPSSSPPSHYIPTRKQPEMLGYNYRSQQHAPMMAPIPQKPATPPAQESYDPFAKTSTMTSTMTASITNRGRYGYQYSADKTTSPDGPRRIRRKKDAKPFK